MIQIRNQWQVMAAHFYQNFQPHSWNMQRTSIKKCFIRLVKSGPSGIKRLNQYPLLRSLIYLIFIMHDFAICVRVWCKEAENERSDKNLGAWAESDDQFSYLFRPITYLILLYSKLCEKFSFIILNTFFHDLTKMSGP